MTDTPAENGNDNSHTDGPDKGNDPTTVVATVDPPDSPPDVDPEQAAALRAKMRESVQRLALQYQEQRGVLTKEGLAQEEVKGPDAIAARAHAQAEAGELRDAITTYKKAVDAVIDEIAALEKRRLQETRDIAKAVATHREKLRAYDELDQEIIQQVASYERNYRDGDRALRAMRFTDAQAAYEAAEKTLRTIETLLAEKFTPREGHDFTVPGLGMEFVWIQSMRIWVGKYEVTNGEYRVFRDTHTSRDTEDGLTLDGERQPACRMSYYHTVEFCNWMTHNMARLKLLPTDYTFRLPTKPEWIQFACEGEERLYPWGNDWPPKYGNFGNEEVFPNGFSLQPYTDPYPATCPVEKSGKNGWGLYGTAGNVWEWTSTASGNNRFVFGAAWTVVTRRVLEVDPDKRNIADPGMVDYDNIGFRVILAPKAEHD